MDAEDAIEAAAFGALNVSEVTSLATVLQHVPEGTPPPVVIIGDMDSDASFGDKDNGDELINLTIVGVIAGEERKPLRAIKTAVKGVLNGFTTTKGGWQLQFTYTGSDGQYLAADKDAEDQGAYLENFRFSVFALKQ